MQTQECKILSISQIASHLRIFISFYAPILIRSGTYSFCLFFCFVYKKKLALAVTFECLVIEPSYFKCVILVVRPYSGTMMSSPFPWQFSWFNPFHGQIQGGGGGGGGPGVRTPPGILAKMCLLDLWNGTGLILHSIYVKYSHKLKKKGSKCGDILMVRTGNFDLSCKRLTSIEIRKSKYHIIRRVRFRWDPPLRKISGSALAFHNNKILDSSKLQEFSDDNIRSHENIGKFSKMVENAVGKGEIAHHEQFCFFSKSFRNTFTAET